MCFAMQEHGDSPIASLLEFQFPFRRDVLCNCFCASSNQSRLRVSIPFSSGCALQSHQKARSRRYLLGFNSLFVGMCFAIERDCQYVWCRDLFQFPFRRDVLCNSANLTGGNQTMICFNSLFVGMCFAISSLKSIAAVGFAFQFPCRRDVLGKTNFAGGWDEYNIQFQFPFRRDVLCNLLSILLSCR